MVASRSQKKRVCFQLINLWVHELLAGQIKLVNIAHVEIVVMCNIWYAVALLSAADDFPSMKIAEEVDNFLTLTLLMPKGDGCHHVGGEHGVAVVEWCRKWS